MATYYITLWEGGDGKIIEVDAPSAVEACRRAGLEPKRCLAARQPKTVMICPAMLDMTPEDLDKIQKHARSCRTCSRIVNATAHAISKLFKH
jgi:hypothetical protein